MSIIQFFYKDRTYRPILPQYREFFAELIKNKQPQERLFNLPTDTKKARLEKDLFI